MLVLTLIGSNLILWDYTKDCVFVAPLPQDLAYAQERIEHAVIVIDRGMMQRVWYEL